MKQYEITFLTREEPKDNTLILKEIENVSGRIVTKSNLGQRELTYPIKKEKSAFYSTIIFEVDGQKIPELSRKLNLHGEILRHLIVGTKKAKPVSPKVTKKPLVTEPVKEKAAPETAAPEKKTVVKEIKEVKELEKPIIKPPKKEIKKTVKAEPIPDEKERLKALDEKLDELLKE